MRTRVRLWAVIRHWARDDEKKGRLIVGGLEERGGLPWELAEPRRAKMRDVVRAVYRALQSLTCLPVRGREP